MNEMQITLTFSDDDFDVIDAVAKVMGWTRDRLLKEMFSDVISRHIKEQIEAFRETLRTAKVPYKSVAAVDKFAKKGKRT